MSVCLSVPNRWPVTFEGLFELLAGIHPISDAFRAAIEQEIALVSLPKNHALLEAPRISDQAWFLQNGFAMSYVYDDRGIHVENFWHSGEIILSVKSFFEQTPAMENIRLLIPSKVVVISYSGMQRLFDTFPEAHVIYEAVITQYYERSRKRAQEMRNTSALERYRTLLSEFPGIERTVSQEYIASYLGIAPQSLSRLKRKFPKT